MRTAANLLWRALDAVQTSRLAPPYLVIFLGVVVLVAGVLAIVFRTRIHQSSLRNQARLFGQEFADSRRSTPAAIGAAGVVPVLIGVILLVVGIVRVVSGA